MLASAGPTSKAREAAAAKGLRPAAAAAIADAGCECARCGTSTRVSVEKGFEKPAGAVAGCGMMWDLDNMANAAVAACWVGR